jgi:hypothetical protein
MVTVQEQTQWRPPGIASKPSKSMSILRQRIFVNYEE